MVEVLLSNTTQPPDPFRGAPRTLIYDPGRFIQNPRTQLYPFGSLVEICHRPEDLVDQIQNSEDEQLFLLLIFPTKDGPGVKRFLRNHISDNTRLFSLFLIFPNGLQCHEQWISDPSMPKLRWCRSFTNQLIRDILDVCKSACNQHITFYEQRKIAAQDAIERNTISSTESLVILFSGKIKEYSNLLSNYLKVLSESDD